MARTKRRKSRAAVRAPSARTSSSAALYPVSPAASASAPPSSSSHSPSHTVPQSSAAAINVVAGEEGKDVGAIGAAALPKAQRRKKISIKPRPPAPAAAAAASTPSAPSASSSASEAELGESAEPAAKRRKKAPAQGRAMHTSFTYPDPNDVDDNPLLLPLYRPSALPSPALFAHITAHLDAFGLSQTPLVKALNTTAATISYVLKRKYKFKALGIVRGMREWISARDRHNAALCTRALRSAWDLAHAVQRQQRDDEKMREDGNVVQEGDWLEPEWLQTALRSIAPLLEPSAILDFAHQRLSLERRLQVEKALGQWLNRAEQEEEARRTRTAIAAAKRATREAEAVVPGAPLPIEAKERRRPSAPSKKRKRLKARRNHVMSNGEVKGEGEEMKGAERTNGASSSPGESTPGGSSDSDAEVRTTRTWRRPRPEALSGVPQSVVAVAHASPFTDPSWRVRSQPPRPFSWVATQHASITFHAPSPVTLAPFTAASSSSSLFLHAGGPISAMAFAPVGSPSHSPMAQPQFLATAHSQFPHLSPHRRHGLGVIALWSVESDTAARVTLAIEHGRGDVLAMEWYPGGVWEAHEAKVGEEKRLGVLAVAFSNGTVEVVMLPQPRPQWKDAHSVTLNSLPHVTLDPPPLFEDAADLPLPVPTSIAFSLHAAPPYLAVGLSNGALVVYSLRRVHPGGGDPRPSFHLLPRAGHHAVRAVRFSPVNPHQVLLGTGDGYALLIDVRTPHFPLYHLSLSAEPITALYWPACRPDLYVAVTSSSARSHSLVLRPDRAHSLRGLGALPVAPYSTCWALAVVEDPGNAVVFAACGWSDGSVHAVSHAWDDMEKQGKGRSAGLSITRPRPGTDGLEVVDGVEVALAHDRDRPLREARMKEAGSAMKAEERALDDRLAIGQSRQTQTSCSRARSRRVD